MSSLTFQQTPATFRVEERLAYEPCGSGDHVFAQILKRGISTGTLKRRISEHGGIPLAVIRHAGRKDTAATALQWLSWPAARQQRALVDLPDAEILTITRHGNALAVGHVHHNRFVLRLSHAGAGPVPRPARPDAAFANYYGGQRFGQWDPTREGIAQRLARPQKPAKTVSVYQAWLFNAWLRARLARDGFAARTEDLWTATNGKRWFAAQPDEELLERYRSGSISPTGPIYGYKVKLTDSEQAFLAEHGLEAEAFRPWGKFARGARRPLFVVPAGVRWQPGEAGEIDWSFELPSGAYATVYLSQVFFRDILQRPLEDWPDYTREITLPLETDEGLPAAGGGR